MWILLTGPSDEQNPYANKVRDAYHKYMGLATLAANRILHNLEDARDAAMQAFVRVLEHPEKVFDGRSDEYIKNYIVIIARNTACLLYTSGMPTKREEINSGRLFLFSFNTSRREWVFRS